MKPSQVFLVLLLVVCAVAKVVAQEPGSNDRVNRGWILSSEDSPLKTNQYLVSPNEKYFLAMQWDGNLVQYEGKDPANGKGVVWQTQTNRLPHDKYILSMQNDGNLVIYKVAYNEKDEVTNPKRLF